MYVLLSLSLIELKGKRMVRAEFYSKDFFLKQNYILLLYIYIYINIVWHVFMESLLLKCFFPSFLLDISSNSVNRLFSSDFHDNTEHQIEMRECRPESIQRGKKQKHGFVLDSYWISLKVNLNDWLINLLRLFSIGSNVRRNYILLAFFLFLFIC